jgi:hypothetical protein
MISPAGCSPCWSCDGRADAHVVVGCGGEAADDALVGNTREARPRPLATALGQVQYHHRNELLDDSGPEPIAAAHQYIRRHPGEAGDARPGAEHRARYVHDRVRDGRARIAQGDGPDQPSRPSPFRAATDTARGPVRDCWHGRALRVSILTRLAGASARQSDSPRRESRRMSVVHSRSGDIAPSSASIAPTRSRLRVRKPPVLPRKDRNWIAFSMFGGTESVRRRPK